MKINDWVLPLRKRKVVVEMILVRSHTHIFAKNKIAFKLGSPSSFFNCMILKLSASYYCYGKK